MKILPPSPQKGKDSGNRASRAMTAATRTMRPLVMKNFFKAWPWVIRGDARLQGRRAGCAAVRAPSPKSREG